MQAMAAWFANPNAQMYGMWDSSTPGLHSNGTVTPGEGGVDLGAPIGTPVYAIANGTIEGAGYWNDIAHGVITTRVQVPGYGTEDLYYQHIVLNPAIKQCQNDQCTQSVHKGELLGVVGQYGETEMGFNADWGGIWGVNHPGAWQVDPRPMLGAMLGQGAPATLGGQPTITGNPSAYSYATGSDVTTNASSSSQGPNPEQWFITGGLFLIALVLVLGGLYMLFHKQINGLVGGTTKTAAKVAML